ncbi:hypothetical protein P7C70_g6908, partial [Phenoliferia sp. Uapishka_3]
DNTSELGMKDLLAKFNQLQVTMAQLATNQAQAVAGGFGGATYAPRRTSFSGIPRPQTPTFQNASTTRWPARPKDAPPHEANNAAYESNFVGSGTNAIPVNTTPVNQWGTRPQTVPVNTPYAPRPPPICLWCAGEDGEPHWMSACHDLQSALASGVIRKDNEGKTRYGARYVPSRAHPRGMRAWVKEQEVLAKAPVTPTVRFDVATNSVEYDPPQVSEGDGEYETANVRVDEYEVNQTKRTRSASPDSSHPRKSSPRNFKPRVNDFEDLGVPKSASVMREDEIMGEVPKKRQTRPKLESAMESRSDPRDFLDQILKQRITIPMNVMLANSPELAKLMVRKGKWGRLARRNERSQKAHKMNFLSEKERRKDRVPSKQQIAAEVVDYQYRQYELKEEARRAHRPEDDDNLMIGGRPSPAFKDLLARADRIEAAERAIMNKRKSEEELEKIFPRRTAPWIASCTADEARERAQLLRDEYDKFLAVLFGRKIPISRPSLEERGYYSQELYSRQTTDEFGKSLFGMGPRLQGQKETGIPAEVSPLQILVDSGIKPDKARDFLDEKESTGCEGFRELAAELLNPEAMNEIFEEAESAIQSRESSSFTPPLGKRELTRGSQEERPNTSEKVDAGSVTAKSFSVEDWLAKDDDLCESREEVEDSRVAWRKYCADAAAKRSRDESASQVLSPQECAFRASNQKDDVLIRELGLKLETTELTSNLVEWVNDSDDERIEGELLEENESADERSSESSLRLTSNMVQLKAWGVRRSDGSSMLGTRRQIEGSESDSDEGSFDESPLDHEWESEDSMPSLMSASEDGSERSERRTLLETTTLERDVAAMESWCETDSEFEWVSGSEEDTGDEEEQDTSWRDARERLMKMMKDATYELNNAELAPSESDSELSTKSSGKVQPLATTSARERMYQKSPASLSGGRKA